MNPNQDNQSQPDPKLQSVYNPLSVMREDEQVLSEIRRHPIGIIGVYLGAALVVVAAITGAIVAPSHISNLNSSAKEAFMFGALIITIVAALYVYVARVIYNGNRWILTDDSLTQVTQNGLFKQHSSQLSLANLEDITADQSGIIQTMLGYGTLRAETAGERSKFVFPFCPKPTEHARKILAARESFIMDQPEAAKRANDKLLTPPPPLQGQTYTQPVYQQPQPPVTQPTYTPDPSPDNSSQVSQPSSQQEAQQNWQQPNPPQPAYQQPQPVYPRQDTTTEITSPEPPEDHS